MAGLLAHSVSLPLVLRDALYLSQWIFGYGRLILGLGYSLWTCCTTSRRMGAVRTAGRGSEVEASAFLLSARRSQGSTTTLCSPPDVERTLTVGREAILEDSLEGCLDAAASGTTVWT